MGDGLQGPARYWRALTLRLLAAAAVVLALTVCLTPLSASAHDWSPPRTVFVPTTGHTTDGLFLDLWRAERELIGDPVTEEIHPRTNFTATKDAGIVQYYENVALVYLPDEAPENQVQLVDLGRQALEEAKSSSVSRALDRALERSVCAPTTAGACVNVVASGHTVRGPFLDRWQTGGTATWLGVPLTESFIAPDGTRVQYFENGMLRQTVSGEVEPLPLGSIAAKRAKLDVEPIERPQDVPVYDEELFIPPPDATPVGHHAVIAKFDAQTMEGTISGEYYRVEDVPYVMYFDNNGNAIHGTYWHSNFGAPMSHGCVNLPMDVAAWMYGWADVGTAVSVIS